MHSFETILIMLVAILVSNLISQRFSRVSTPLIQIALGIILALIPMLHFEIELDPELFLVLFIAPLLFEDAIKADKPTLWSLKRPILLLALGLVFLTTVSVGTFVHFFIPAIPLAAAFALAAALAPTDAVAVISLGETTTIKPQKRAILQGEALFNDASSIVSFQFALAVLAVGPFAAAAATDEVHFAGSIVLTFLFMFIGGVIVGVVLMVLRLFLVQLMRRAGIENITFHVLFEVITPLLVFLIAEAVGVSGIIAVVVAGIAHSFVPRRQTPDTARHKIVSASVWSMVGFTLNGLVFLILGTQLPHVVEQVWVYSSADHNLLIIAIVLILLAILLIRFVWIFIMNRKEFLVLEESGEPLTMTAAFSQAAHGEQIATENYLSPDRCVVGSIAKEFENENIEGDERTVTFKDIADRRKAEKREKERMRRSEQQQRHRELVAAERNAPGYFAAHAQNALVLTLAGVKGAISLALLLTIPLTMPNGMPFPERNLLLFLASGVIVLSLLLANFVMPLVAPKSQKEKAPEAERKAALDIHAHVVRRLAEQMTPENRVAVEAVIRQYNERSASLGATSGATNPLETVLRQQIIDWQRDYTLKLVDDGRVSAPTASAYIYQLSRVLANIEHHGEMRWFIRNSSQQFVHQMREGRRFRKEHAEEIKEDERLGRRQTIRVLRELQRENYEHVLERLKALRMVPGAPSGIIDPVIVDYERRLYRFKIAEETKSPLGLQLDQQRRAHFEKSLLEMQTRALRYERDAIELAFSEGRISNETARHLRDNVAMMEFDIEEQLE